MPPMNGWLNGIHRSDLHLAMGGHFCVLLLSFCPIVYPSAKQVKPKLKTASSTSTVIILQALLSEIHNNYSVSSLRRDTGPSVGEPTVHRYGDTSHGIITHIPSDRNNYCRLSWAKPEQSQEKEDIMENSLHLTISFALINEGK